MAVKEWEFAERVVVVTGAGRGIGRSISRAFAEAGAEVVIADKDPRSAEEAASDLKGVGRAYARTVDVASEQGVVEFSQWLQEAFGVVHVLVNNAGVGIHASLTALSSEEWDQVLDTNAKGAFLCTKHLLPLLEQGRQAAVVNISSTRADMSEPNTFPYSASKGALRSLTHSLAVSLGRRGIRVNCISPGWIHNGDPEELTEQDHDQHPVGRVGRPEDVAEACLFLASPRAGFITGTNLTIDGGMTVKMIYRE